MPDNNSDGQFHPLLLRALCPDDRDEAIRLYLLLQKKLENYFCLNGMSDPATDADETFKRAEEKLAKGLDIPDVKKFSMGIARNVVHERRRQRQHEESAFLNFLDYSQDKSTESLVDKIMNLMKPCFEELPEDDQNLLISYCKVPPGVDRAEHRRQLALSRNSSISALRIRITRLRRDLEDCVKGRSKNL